MRIGSLFYILSNVFVGVSARVGVCVCVRVRVRVYVGIRVSNRVC